MKKGNPNPSEWFRIGEKELALAEAVFAKIRQKQFYDNIGAFCQQAIEKYLNGYLYFVGYKPEKTHDLDFLIRKCIEFNPEFYKYKDNCKKISGYWISPRYPIGLLDLSKAQVEEALKTAQSILKFVKAKIKS